MKILSKIKTFFLFIIQRSLHEVIAATIMYAYTQELSISEMNGSNDIRDEREELGIFC